jgi:glutamyl-Q tRNA(Asp) synthetase
MSIAGRSAYRGRFAPSPTGLLHFGSLVAALGSWLRAQAEGGVWLIRIEDLDIPREVPGASQAIIETLAAFGMTSDEPIVYQRERGDRYGKALQQLIDAGAAFACRCSRSDVGAEGIHRGCVAGARADRDPAWRLRVPTVDVGFVDVLQGPQTQRLDTAVGDFVLRRADGTYAYQLAVVVDDAEQGVTEVVRGADLLDSTPRQIHLQRLLGLRAPGYLHLPLAVGADGSKLSKQTGSLPIDPADPIPALRAALSFLGYPEAPFADLRTPESVLALACAGFDVGNLPRRLQAVAPSAEANER